MPYLQLDVSAHYSPEVKQQLATRLCHTYARVMGADLRRITVAIRELGEGGVWRVLDGETVPAAMLSCDVRRGRPADQRMAAARALCEDCADVLGLARERLNVEFTQHAGDEMYHPALGGWSPEWAGGDG